MKIYCRNYECFNIKMLAKSERFYPTRGYIPIGKDDNICGGVCSKSFCGFLCVEVKSSSIKHKLAFCSVGSYEQCTDYECLHNSGDVCNRKEILVDKTIISYDFNSLEDCWVCKCRSSKGFSGHMDWSRLGKQKDMF